MLTYNFLKKGSDTLYYFLYKNIKNDIINKNLKPGEKLPSKRGLATHLNISVITVENAYAQLLVEGYIYSIEKKGYYVSELNHDYLVQPTLQPATPTIKAKPTPPLIDFKSGNISPNIFPFSIWSKLMRQVLSEKDPSLLQQTPYNGVYVLRNAIANHLHSFRGMNISPDQIVVGAGTEYLYNLLIQLLGRKNLFALEDPGYMKIAKIYSLNDVKCKYIPLDDYGLCVESLEVSKANIAHISPSHHFPTGIVTPITRRHELLNWANAENHRYIIEDDYDSEFRFFGRPIQTMASIDQNEKVIYMNTFSKSITSSIRISYMVLPKHLTHKLKEKMGFYACTVSTFEQFTLAKFIQDGYFQRNINRMRNYYKTQRDIIISLIKQSPIGDKILILEENSGPHFILQVNTPLTDAQIIKKAADNNIKLDCLSSFYHNKAACINHRIIINYSSLESSQLKDSVSALLSIF